MSQVEDLKNSIKNLALSLGFDDVGIASVHGDLPHVNNFRQAEQEGRFGPLDYLYRTKEQRCDILSVFPEAKTVIVMLKNYYTGDHSEEISHHRFKIARYAWGKDYHHWFKKQLKLFALSLAKLIGKDIKHFIFNDTSPVLERSWAVKSGLGFIGKSSMFISRKMGTWTLIGGLAIDFYVPEDDPYDGPNCGSCHKCIDQCPTKAIIKPYQVDARKCVSTWSIERPLHPSVFNSSHDGSQSFVFGCDICQEVCPWNKFQVKTYEERFKPLSGRVFFTKETLTQNLAGSPLYRSSKPGLLLNYLRIRQSIKKQNCKVY